MASIDRIIGVANGLIAKYATRNPYELCEALGVRIRLKDLGPDIKAYYFYHSRIRNIILNTRMPETMRRILAAHELGHDQLHLETAMLKGFHETKLFDAVIPTEYEANIFAAEILIGDSELLELLSEEGKSYFDVAKELCILAPLLDFKLRILKYKGYDIQAPYAANGNFLKDSVGDCYNEEYG